MISTESWKKVGSKLVVINQVFFDNISVSWCLANKTTVSVFEKFCPKTTWCLFLSKWDAIIYLFQFLWAMKKSWLSGHQPSFLCQRFSVTMFCQQEHRIHFWDIFCKKYLMITVYLFDFDRVMSKFVVIYRVFFNNVSVSWCFAKKTAVSVFWEILSRKYWKSLSQFIRSLSLSNFSWP